MFRFSSCGFARIQTLHALGDSLSLLHVSNFFMRFCSDSDLKAVGAGSSHNMSSNITYTNGMPGFTASFLVRIMNTCQVSFSVWPGLSQEPTFPCMAGAKPSTPLRYILYGQG